MTDWYAALSEHMADFEVVDARVEDGWVAEALRFLTAEGAFARSAAEVAALLVPGGRVARDCRAAIAAVDDAGLDERDTWPHAVLYTLAAVGLLPEVRDREAAWLRWEETDHVGQRLAMPVRIGDRAHGNGNTAGRVGRDPGRIGPVLAQIEALWRDHPDWRLGQLVANAAGRERDVFNIEDDVLLDGVIQLRALPVERHDR